MVAVRATIYIFFAYLAVVSCGKFGRLKRKVNILKKELKGNQNDVVSLEKFKMDAKDQAYFVWQWGPWSQCEYDGSDQGTRTRIGQNCLGIHCFGKNIQTEDCISSKNYV